MAFGAVSASDESGGGSGYAKPEDERIRALIRGELDRRYAFKVARRTLELLAEAAVEPTQEGPGYRIVDRAGQTRYHQGSEPGSRKGAVPMTLSDLVDELAERYPDLFGKPPEPAPMPVLSDPEPDHDTIAEVRAAGARFVEHQTSLAKSLASNSAERGRALADRVSGTFEGWRGHRGERSKAADTAETVESPDPMVSGPANPPLPSEASPPPASEAAPPANLQEKSVQEKNFQEKSVQETGGGFGDRVREGLHGLVHRVRSEQTAIFGRRVVFTGLAGLIVLAGLAAYLILRPDSSPSPATEPQIAETGKDPGQTKPPAAETATNAAGAKPPAEDTGEDPAQNPNALKGLPEVIDTATLKVADKVVRLFGVEWVRGAQGQDLTRYLSGRSVVCLPAPGSTAYTCTVEGRDLSEVVLYNGGGRASSEAAPEHVAAEDHAREERIGVWKR